MIFYIYKWLNGNFNKFDTISNGDDGDTYSFWLMLSPIYITIPSTFRVYLFSFMLALAIHSYHAIRHKNNITFIGQSNIHHLHLSLSQNQTSLEATEPPLCSPSSSTCTICVEGFSWKTTCHKDQNDVRLTGSRLLS